MLKNMRVTLEFARRRVVEQEKYIESIKKNSDMAPDRRLEIIKSACAVRDRWVSTHLDIFWKGESDMAYPLPHRISNDYFDDMLEEFSSDRK